VLSGDGVIEVALTDVPLLPGTYDLHTEITDFNRTHVYDRLTLAMRFDVMTGKPYETGGVVTLRPQWTFG
jgi:ABC-2 type transport system ATP-binding protein